MTHPLLKDPFIQEIIALLAVSKLLPLEKQLWLSLLEFMTKEEIEKLKDNLQKEVAYEVKVTEKTSEQFLKELEKQVPLQK